MKIINYAFGGSLKFMFRPLFIWWNRIKLRTTGAKLGKHCVIFNRLYYFLHPKGKLKIGNNCIISSGSNFNQLSRNLKGSIYVGENATLLIGDNVGISSSCLWVTESVIIGNHVTIGADTLILDTDAHPLDWRDRRKNGPRNSKPIVIEDDVFIGTRSIILKGVTIGARSVIGAGSVVAKSIPPDCVVAGNPCEIIRRVNLE